MDTVQALSKKERIEIIKLLVKTRVPLASENDIEKAIEYLSKTTTANFETVDIKLVVKPVIELVELIKSPEKSDKLMQTEKDYLNLLPSPTQNLSTKTLADKLEPFVQDLRIALFWQILLHQTLSPKDRIKNIFTKEQIKELARGTGEFSYLKRPYADAKTASKLLFDGNPFLYAFLIYRRYLALNKEDFFASLDFPWIETIRQIEEGQINIQNIDNKKSLIGFLAFVLHCKKSLPASFLHQIKKKSEFTKVRATYNKYEGRYMHGVYTVLEGLQELSEWVCWDIKQILGFFLFGDIPAVKRVTVIPHHSPSMKDNQRYQWIELRIRDKALTEKELKQIYKDIRESLNLVKIKPPSEKHVELFKFVNERLSLLEKRDWKTLQAQWNKAFKKKKGWQYETSNDLRINYEYRAKKKVAKFL